MKKRTFLKSAALCCTIASLLFIFTMCSKDDSDNNSPPTVSYRVTSDSLYINDTLTFTGKFTYNSNMLTEIIYYLLGSEEYMKQVFQYSGNSISFVTLYTKNNGVWNKQTEYEILGYNGDNPTGVIEHYYNEAGVETYKSKTVYIYQGTVLQKTDRYSSETGVWTLTGSTSYQYDDQGRIKQEMDDTTFNYYAHLKSYSYVGDKMSEMLTQEYTPYYGILTNYAKTTFEYVNGHLSKTFDYAWDSGSWKVDGQTRYEYNAAGNLMSVWSDISGYFSYKDVYLYSEGSGNYRQCQKSMGQAPLPGDPTPYPVKPTGSPSIMQYLKK
jgi:hypothetical protein